RTRRLVNAHTDARQSVRKGYYIVAFRIEFDIGHILQAKKLAVSNRADHDVLVLFRRIVSAAILDYVFKGLSIVLPQRAGGCFKTLFVNGSCNIGRHQTVSSKFFGTKPDAHRIVLRTEYTHVANTINTFQRG